MGAIRGNMAANKQAEPLLKVEGLKQYFRLNAGYMGMGNLTENTL